MTYLINITILQRASSDQWKYQKQQHIVTYSSYKHTHRHIAIFAFEIKMSSSKNQRVKNSVYRLVLHLPWLKKWKEIHWRRLSFPFSLFWGTPIDIIVRRKEEEDKVNWFLLREISSIWWEISPVTTQPKQRCRHTWNWDRMKELEKDEWKSTNKNNLFFWIGLAR